MWAIIRFMKLVRWVKGMNAKYSAKAKSGWVTIVHELAVEKSPNRVGARLVGEIERGAQRKERRRHHDQQQVLDHVVAEVLHVVGADEGLGGEEGDEQPEAEADAAHAGPRTSAARTPQ